jgi:hypothetical protein
MEGAIIIFAKNRTLFVRRLSVFWCSRTKRAARQNKKNGGSEWAGPPSVIVQSAGLAAVAAAVARVGSDDAAADSGQGVFPALIFCKAWRTCICRVPSDALTSECPFALTAAGIESRFASQASRKKMAASFARSLALYSFIFKDMLKFLLPVRDKVGPANNEL